MYGRKVFFKKLQLENGASGQRATTFKDDGVRKREEEGVLYAVFQDRVAVAGHRPIETKPDNLAADGRQVAAVRVADDQVSVLKENHKMVKHRRRALSSRPSLSKS